jgi:hypothetical protein
MGVVLIGASRLAQQVERRPGRNRVAALAFGALVLGSACQTNDLLTHYPLDAGRTWQYRVSVVNESGGVVTDTAIVANLPEKEVLGRRGTPQRSQVFGKTVVRFLAATSAGVVEFAQQAGGMAPVATDPPDYILKASIAPGTNWRSVWRSTRDDSAVSLQTVKTISRTRETVMVPAGTFAECLRVKIAGKAQVALPAGLATIEVSGDEWYARDVGFIKGAFRETVNQGEDAVEVTMNLESFSGSN